MPWLLAMPFISSSADALPLHPVPSYRSSIHSDFSSPDCDLSPTRSLPRLSQLSTDTNSSKLFYTESNSSTLPFFGSHRDKRSNSSRFRPCQSSLWAGWKMVLFGSWLNVLLVLVILIPVVSAILPESSAIVFFLCLLSLIPLVKLHDLGMNELSLRIGNYKTGLVNATLSNVVEVVVAVMALRRCELRVVQTMLIGSMLCKLLLVLGLCFFAGGLRFREQAFDPTATQIQSSLLSMSVGAVLLPAAYHMTLSGGFNRAGTSDWQKINILKMSHGVSIILLLVYIAYLLFQLWSHKHLYQDRPPAIPSQPLAFPVPAVRLPYIDSFHHLYRAPKFTAPDKVANWLPESPSSTGSGTRLTPPSKPYGSLARSFSAGSDTTLAVSRSCSSSSDPKGKVMPHDEQLCSIVGSRNSDPYSTLSLNTENPTVRLVSSAPMSKDRTGEGLRYSSQRGHGSSSAVDLPSTPQDGISEQESQLPASNDSSSDASIEEDQPRLGWAMNVSLLIVVTVLVALVADELVESMDGISSHIDKAWIGLILLPAVSSVAEIITAVNVSVKDQLRLSISVAVGSTIQTALFVIPLMVLLGWAMGKPLALLFDPFESIVLYISVQTTSYVVGDGKSNWLEGFILICLYAIMAVSFWFYPDNLTGSLMLLVCKPQT